MIAGNYLVGFVLVATRTYRVCVCVYTHSLEPILIAGPVWAKPTLPTYLGERADPLGRVGSK